MTTLFCNQPAELRMAARDIVDDAGGYVAGYYGGKLQVAVPSDHVKWAEMRSKLRDIGLVGEERITYFPLGSDQPPETLRHFGPGTAAAPRGDRPSYWLYQNFYVEGDQ